MQYAPTAQPICPDHMNEKLQNKWIKKYSLELQQIWAAAYLEAGVATSAFVNGWVRGDPFISDDQLGICPATPRGT